MNRKDFLKTLSLVPIAAVVAPTLLVSESNENEKRLMLPKHTSNADVNIGVNGVERMRITSNGNVLFY